MGPDLPSDPTRLTANGSGAAGAAAEPAAAGAAADAGRRPLLAVWPAPLPSSSPCTLHDAGPVAAGCPGATSDADVVMGCGAGAGGASEDIIVPLGVRDGACRAQPGSDRTQALDATSWAIRFEAEIPLHPHYGISPSPIRRTQQFENRQIVHFGQRDNTESTHHSLPSLGDREFEEATADALSAPLDLDLEVLHMEFSCRFVKVRQTNSDCRMSAECAVARIVRIQPINYLLRMPY